MSDLEDFPFGPPVEEKPELKPDTDALLAQLRTLPKNQAKTAEALWGGIKEIALSHKAASDWLARPAKKEIPCSIIERDLTAAAASVRDATQKLARLTGDHLEMIDEGDMEGYFPWFRFDPSAIFRANDGFDPEDPRACMGEGVALGELRSLAEVLDRAAGNAAKRKAAPNGHRGERWSMASAINPMVGRLFALLMRNGHIKSHVLPIAKAIHTWARPEDGPLSDDWGGMALKRAEKEFTAYTRWFET